MPTAKYSSDSIIPFNDFFEENKKTMKGTRRVTSKKLSNDMFLGNELLAISIILGV